MGDDYVSEDEEEEEEEEGGGEEEAEEVKEPEAPGSILAAFYSKKDAKQYWVSMVRGCNNKMYAC